jgi:hypothetical protein
MLRECFPWVGNPALGGFRRSRNQFHPRPLAIRFPCHADSPLNLQSESSILLFLTLCEAFGAFHNLPAMLRVLKLQGGYASPVFDKYSNKVRRKRQTNAMNTMPQ